jgi:hypothetical protein
MIGGGCHSIKHKSNQPHLTKDSLTELRVVCTIAGDMGTHPDTSEPVTKLETIALKLVIRKYRTP